MNALGFAALAAALPAGMVFVRVRRKRAERKRARANAEKDRVRLSRLASLFAAPTTEWMAGFNEDPV